MEDEYVDMPVPDLDTAKDPEAEPQAERSDLKFPGEQTPAEPEGDT